MGDLDADLAAKVITASADVSLILDESGIVRDVAFGKPDFLAGGAGAWLGRPWAETVSEDSRPKVTALLNDALADIPTAWRQITYPAGEGADIPVLYTAIRLAAPGRSGTGVGTGDQSGGTRVVAIGRDLRSVATMQQRLLIAQQTVERDYNRLRHLETRYRLLFKLSSEAVLFVDSASRRIIEANPTAHEVFGDTGRSLVGRVFPHGIEAEDADAIETLLASVRAIGRGEDVIVRLGPAKREVMVSAALFRFERTVQFLVRLAPRVVGTDGTLVTNARARVLDVVDSAPDGIVVTDLDGVILSANTAFLDYAQVATEAQVRGRPLGRFIGRQGVDMPPLIANLRELETVRQFSTVVHGDVGASTPVEISAVAVPHADRPCLGFIVRAASQRDGVGESGVAAVTVPRSVEQLTELVGRVSLKEIIRETNDMIEKLCIQAALELTGDNRASAAEMLGLSRQSLYVKLRRYNLGDLSPHDST
ncbi:transcriptional regulator PpsR [Roseospira marina]|uniref:transcriptional regulator PpsR n=1 Tax=Roseospira marina TaxID=140057 RepID=UPI0017DD87C6|nr:transcriptional regulator PpsR [Roseospira marina]MBB4315030.1 transcriptional regulator PpsR [Roseospira marina]MBB5088030.1 transcriptional regulator PpsR [Roseospira marina]